MNAQNVELVPVPQPLVIQDRGEELLRLAIEKGANVDTLERLMVMRRELRAEAAKTAFDTAMAAFQKECPPIKKNEPVVVKGSLRYKYAPLDVIVAQTKELIAAYGFSYKVDARIDKDRVLATCEVKHTAGHSSTSSMEVPIDPEAYMNEQQKFASAFTFAKRYAFCSAFGIVTSDEDDDGRGAGKSTPRGTIATKPPTFPAEEGGFDSALAPEGAPEAKKTTPVSKMATDAHKQRMLEKLFARPGEPAHNLVTEYFQAVCALLPGSETLADLKLQWVPVDAEQMNALAKAIADFENGDPPVFPWKVDHAPEPAPKVEKAPEPWESFPLPFGKDAGTTLRALGTKKLFGWWKNYKVETQYNGKPKRAETIAKDTLFRKMLDAAGTHYGFGQKDAEKIYD